jgi:hypothetical protein
MIDEIIVKDNCMPLIVLNSIVDIITSSNFPWYYSSVVSDNDLASEFNKQFNFQFAHVLYLNNIPRNEWFNKIYPITEFLPGFRSLVKLKVNFNPKYSSVIEHGYHTDVSFECNTAILYLNTNDGYTKFESGEKVDSVKNRLVVFPSRYSHTGTTCTDQKGRLVININYF